MIDLLGARRLRLDRGRGREPDAGGPRRARQELPHLDRRADAAAGPRQARGAVRAGQPDRRRTDDDPTIVERWRDGAARAGRLGERAGAAVSLSRLARIIARLWGAARRSGLGAGAWTTTSRITPSSATSRRPGRAGCTNWRRRAMMTRGNCPDDRRCGRRGLALRAGAARGAAGYPSCVGHARTSAAAGAARGARPARQRHIWRKANFVSTGWPGPRPLSSPAAVGSRRSPTGTAPTSCTSTAMRRRGSRAHDPLSRSPIPHRHFLVDGSAWQAGDRSSGTAIAGRSCAGWRPPLGSWRRRAQCWTHLRRQYGMPPEQRRGHCQRH